MGTEIERKFLVIGGAWRQPAPVRFVQGYLCRDRESTVRVRLAGEQAFLNIKGPAKGITRAEFEYGIPVADAAEILKLCQGAVIEKARHLVVHKGTTWEVDEFFGDNAGLVVAEVELEREDQAFERPSWLGAEVTGDPRYLNANLVSHPSITWHDR